MAQQKFSSRHERPHPNCKCKIEFVTSAKVKTPANLTKGFSKTLTVSEEIASALDPLTSLGNVAKHSILKIQLEAIQKMLKFIENNGLIMSRLKAALGLMGTEKTIENQQSK